MRRPGIALLLASATVALAAACSPPGPNATDFTPPPAPTAAVGADGQPIRTLCDLLSASDFGTLAGVTVKAPDAAEASTVAATCEYGRNVRLVANVSPTAEEADKAFDTALRSKTFTTREMGTMAGVDDSAYGQGTDKVGLLVRRRMLVFTLELPANLAEGKPKLIQLSGRLLERAHALGA